jgi:cysteine-rich repeat protein
MTGITLDVDGGLRVICEDFCNFTCNNNQPVCGNSIQEIGEQCDDGNTKNGDGCSSTCTDEPQQPVCGDGNVDPNEQCDDGNTSSGDGCSSTCIDEPQQTVCGDGNVDPSEQCDDGNNLSGDGCSSTCTDELQQPVCGDGNVDTGEQCDDGNTSSGDGCSSTCTVEQPQAQPLNSCETAFAFGDRNRDGNLDQGDVELDDILNTNRWGWQLNVNKGDNFTTPIYAAAGGNDISKGTLVGELTVSYVNDKVAVTFTMGAGNTMGTTQLYVGGENVQNAAPGTYGNLHEGMNAATSDSYEITVDPNATSMKIVAHADVCGPNNSNK